jgi:trk system potassium uptake protein
MIRRPGRRTVGLARPLKWASDELGGSGAVNILLSARLAGWLLVFLGGVQAIPLMAAFYFGEPLAPFLAAGAIALALGLPAALGVTPENIRIRPRDGFFIVTGAWLLASLFGALPYLATGALGPVDALFESVSGFTTTGSTVLTEIESRPRSLLLWRSMTQWLGGMGIVVFTIALMPILGIGGMQLFKAEVPGPVTEKIRPRVAETARRLWFIYVGLTAMEVLALWVAGMTGFDALCHSLTTLSTGGFSTRNASIGSFDSAAVESIVIVFMVLAGVNFVLHYKLLAGQGRSVIRDRELRYFLSLAVLATAAMAFGMLGQTNADGEPLVFRQILFTVVSLSTGTGYATADFERWSTFAHVILLILMILGAMAGSTGGGVKSLRVVLVIDAVRKNLKTAGHRNAVRSPVQHAGKPVPDDVLAAVWVFLAVYLALIGVMTLMIAAYGYDLETALSGGITSVANVGPGLGEIGAFDHFAHFPAPVKIALAFCMIAGRLEIFTVLVLLSPAFWRR